MTPTPFSPRLLAVLTLSALSGLAIAQTTTQSTDADGVSTLDTVRVLGTAEEALRQAPGVSTITAQDLRDRPPANDIADLIRRMPGVNLTGNSASGAYGNNRQIDLRGMGPENTLILIDGKPVTSRDSVRMGRNGERNTRGDSNWVPANAIERIEVLRGPAASRYGSGAAGGVVNIITKAPTDTFTGSMTVYGLVPENSDEGGTKRLGFNIAGPLADRLSFRLYGNTAKTDGDSPKLNAAASGIDATGTAVPPAGREGVRNRDINALIRLDLTAQQVLEFEGGYSRQGNIYAGDRLFTGSNAATAELANAGAETNIMYRRTGAITHRGNWSEGRTSRVTASYEGTTNYRINQGLAGSGEGAITDPNNKSESELGSYILNGEFNTPLRLAGINQVLTVGGELRRAKLHDPYSTSGGRTTTGNSDENSKMRMSAVFVENNIEVTDKLILTPGLRMDESDKFGVNWSPSLNASYYVTPEVTLKGGIARAFKAPNLYQVNPNYMYSTRGNGCPYVDGTRVGGPCNIFGNDKLDPEISVNKEIGIAYDSRGWGAGLTYFHNDYKNKIVADMGEQGIPDFVNGYRAFQWVNSGKAVVRGLEGNLNIPLVGENGRILKLSNNFTSMIENHNKANSQPLSVIPRYTINSTLDWRLNEKVSVAATGTFYGRQKPRGFNPANNTTPEGQALSCISQNLI